MMNAPSVMASNELPGLDSMPMSLASRLIL